MSIDFHYQKNNGKKKKYFLLLDVEISLWRNRRRGTLTIYLCEVKGRDLVVRELGCGFSPIWVLRSICSLVKKCRIVMGQLQTNWNKQMHVKCLILMHVFLLQDKKMLSSTQQSNRGKMWNSVNYICFQMFNDSSESDNGILGIIRGNPCSASRSSDTFTNVRKWEVLALRMESGLSCIDIALYKVVLSPTEK